ncbi:UNVERIFIED_CONTAM: hypothetical protein Scaly_2605700 [Sesamum calycinum]|uniref:CCHC-type domain-containing protein n=1 Tax=Sesamum calycinum TaxID=2727403 RepID=A0AAW2JCN0_9LAMI
MRLRVAIDVTKPLPRVLKIRTVLGDEHTVTFTYERLPNFCYLCGKLGHISKWCDSRFQSEFVDPGENSPYGPWLRAVGRGDSRTRFPQIREPQMQPPLARPRFTSRSHQTPALSSELIRGSAIFGDFSQPAASTHKPPMSPRTHPQSLSTPPAAPSHDIQKARPKTESSPNPIPNLPAKRKVADENIQDSDFFVPAKIHKSVVRSLKSLTSWWRLPRSPTERHESPGVELSRAGEPYDRRSGGLALLWQKSIEVQLQSFSSYHMDVSVRLNEVGDWWRFTGIYGEPDTGKRFEFWNLLCRLHHQSIRPWLCAGDFNEILAHSEKKGGPLRAEWQIRNFRNCLAECSLHDLGFQGATFTWCNNQQEPTPQGFSGISRGVGNVFGLKRLGSKNRLVWILLKKLGRPRRSRTEGRLRKKLSMVSARLSCWGRLYGRATRDRIKELERLLVARKQSRMTQDNRDQMSSDKAELSKLILQEETFWKQRSKDLWLKEGDRNSSFFHAKASRRHQTNSIRKLRNPDGSWTETAEGVQRCILEYFQGVFTS